MDAVFTLLGGLAGTVVFAHLHESLIPMLYTPTSLGQLTLVDWFGHPGAALGFLIILFGVGVLLVGRFWSVQNG